jgi:hypothetical protein
MDQWGMVEPSTTIYGARMDVSLNGWKHRTPPDVRTWARCVLGVAIGATVDGALPTISDPDGELPVAMLAWLALACVLSFGAYGLGEWWVCAVASAARACGSRSP